MTREEQPVSIINCVSYRRGQHVLSKMLDVNFDVSSAANFKALNLNCLTVYERVDFNRFITIFKCLIIYFNCFSIKAKSKHNLRCNQDFALNYGPYLWNHLKAKMKNTECLCVFKNMCKKYILDLL